MVKFGGAGAHFDPKDTKNHGAPHNREGEAHAGDIENLLVGADNNGSLDFGTAKLTVSAVPLSLAGRSVVIHANEDKFSNDPPLGGRGEHIACGVIRLL
jgi:Cu-Zn family superoxide dismutase